MTQATQKQNARAAARARVTVGQGSLATSGNSHALRIDKSFVRNNPVLAQTGLRVQFKKIATNTFVFVVLDAPSEAQEGDPVIESYLAFLESDMRAAPSRLAPLTEPDASNLERLVRGVDVDDEAEISRDFTL
jgi:hypothetical protein